MFTLYMILHVISFSAPSKTYLAVPKSLRDELPQSLQKVESSSTFCNDLRYVYTLRLIGPLSYLGACYIRTKVIKCIREKMTMYFRRLAIKSHSSGYEIGPINRSV